jgi:hypothetical protein
MNEIQKRWRSVVVSFRFVTNKASILLLIMSKGCPWYGGSEPEFVNFKEPWKRNRFRQPMQLGRPVQQIRFSYWPARIHRLEESIPGLLKVRLWRGFSIFVCFYHLSDVGCRLSGVDFDQWQLFSNGFGCR